MLLWQTIHGHLALLGLALCLHPVLGLRRRKRPSRGVLWSGALATATTVAVSALGWFIYPAYRQHLRRPLYAADVRLGLAFEIKEHLAFFALLLAVAGGALLWQARGPHGARLRRPIMAAYGLAALLTAVVCALGIWLAVTKGFPTRI
ncbi:MAG: hypothetical protein H6702_22175 [Myxococcales bacterium]|nr:hypothetical protein [Myxococcales bacterium]